MVICLNFSPLEAVWAPPLLLFPTLCKVSATYIRHLPRLLHPCLSNMSRNVKLSTFAAFISLHDWSVHMHDELAFLPGFHCDVEKGYFVRASIFVFNSELVPFKKVVFRRNELDSWWLFWILNRDSLFSRCTSCQWLPVIRCFLCTKLLWASSSSTSTVEVFITCRVGTWWFKLWFDFCLTNNWISLGGYLERSVCKSSIVRYG